LASLEKYYTGIHGQQNIKIAGISFAYFDYCSSYQFYF